MEKMKKTRQGMGREREKKGQKRIKKSGNV